MISLTICRVALVNRELCNNDKVDELKDIINSRNSWEDLVETEGKPIYSEF